MKKLLLFLLLFPSLLFAQGLPIRGGASSDLANVNTNKSLEVVLGKSIRPTYIASSSFLVTTALYNLTIESSAGTGFKLIKWCVGVSNATAATGITVKVNRRTTASSAGTLITAEATGDDSVSKLDPADANFGGIVRRTSTLGTIGATLDQQGFTIGELGAGAADTNSQAPFCKTYGESAGEKPIVVLAGVTNGISINVSTHGAGGLAFGSISATFISE